VPTGRSTIQIPKQSLSPPAGLQDVITTLLDETERETDRETSDKPNLVSEFWHVKTILLFNVYSSWDINKATKSRYINNKSSKGYHMAYNLYVKASKTSRNQSTKQYSASNPSLTEHPLQAAVLKDPLFM
jgi:hypothetical protein